MKTYQERKRLQEKAKARIKAINDLPNFLFVTEAKTRETKKFLEDIGRPKERESWDVHEDGMVFIRNPYNKIIEVTTVTKLCERLIKEMKDR